MNKINPNFHQRKSIRLQEYDYSQAGLYFITICTQNRECLFGDVINGEMVLNDAGMMVEKWYYELENKFSYIRCHEMIVMPNHFHCIVENVGIVGTAVGTDLRVCPNINDENVNPISGEHIGSPLRRVVQWFKTMTTNEYIRGVKSMGWQPFDGKFWQRNYYEHVIRNEQSFQNLYKTHQQ